MIELNENGIIKFTNKWNSCVKQANRVNDKSQANHIVQCAYSDLRSAISRRHNFEIEDAEIREDKEKLEELKKLESQTMDDRSETWIEKHGLVIDLKSCITINCVQYSFNVPASWLDFSLRPQNDV